MRISDWSSDVCSSDLENLVVEGVIPDFGRIAREAAPDMAAPVDHRDRGPAEQRRWQLGLRLVRTADHQRRVEGAVAGEPQRLATRRRRRLCQQRGEARTGERRGGNECGSTGSSGWAPYH